jgi:hypothetical protein
VTFILRGTSILPDNTHNEFTFDCYIKVKAILVRSIPGIIIVNILFREQSKMSKSTGDETNNTTNDPPPASKRSWMDQIAILKESVRTTQQQVPSLKESIQKVVHTTNESLASLEGTYVRTIQEPATKTWQQLSHTTLTMTHQLSDVYDQRHVYGPYGIVLASLVAGTITTLRRGRISGAVSTLVVGGVSYGIVYGLDQLPLLVPTSLSDRWK